MCSDQKSVLRISVSASSPKWRSSYGQWQALICLSAREQEILTKKFCAWVDTLSNLNAHNRAWWYTWLSSRDQLNCQALPWWRELFSLEALLVSNSNSLIEVQLSSPVLIQSAKLLAKKYSWKVEVNCKAEVSQVFYRFIYYPARYVYRWLKFILYAFVAWSNGLKLPSNQKKLDQNNNFLIVTIFHGTEFRNKGNYRDTYFGNLANFLDERDFKSATTGFCYENPGSIFKGIAAYQDSQQLILPFGCCMGIGELLSVFWRTAIFPFQLVWYPAEYPGWQYCAETPDAWMYGLSLLGELTLKRLLNISPKASVIHILENNPWERAVFFAVKGAGKAAKRIGFHHCSVTPFHLKNRFSLVEKDLGLLPDVIVSTGTEATKALSTLSAVELPIRHGCDLRSTTASQKGFAENDGSRQTGAVLVVLEGVWKSKEVVSVFLKFAEKYPHSKVYFRPHPALPNVLEETLALLGEDLNHCSNVYKSLGGLDTDLGMVSLVVYQGSTVAITAAKQGLPLAHFSTDLYPTDNPLFLCNPEIKDFKTLEELEQLVDRLVLGSLYSNADLEKIKRYADLYLSDISEIGLSSFLA